MKSDASAASRDYGACIRIVVSVGMWGSARVVFLLLSMASIPCSRVATICSNCDSIVPGCLLFSWVVGTSGMGTLSVFYREIC